MNEDCDKGVITSADVLSVEVRRGDSCENVSDLANEFAHDESSSRNFGRVTRAIETLDDVQYKFVRVTEGIKRD